MRTPVIALLGSVTYATARYNVFKGVPWCDWPTYTLNKALALSALCLMVISVGGKSSAPGNPKARAVQMASVFGFLHVMLSLVLLSPAYYERLFVEGRLTAAAGLSMLLGVVAAAAMAGGKGTRRAEDASGGPRNLALLALVVGFHAMLLGFAGWFAPSEWPGMMPPITLIAFLLGLAAVTIALPPRRTT